MSHLSRVYIYRIPESIINSLQPIQTGLNQQLLPAEKEDDSSDEESDNEHEIEEITNEFTSARLLDEVETIRPAIGSPITWFTSTTVPPPTKMGVYTAMLTTTDTTIKSIQDINQQGGTVTDRTIAMFMVGGGHFQGTIISLTQSSESKCVIKASKGFHRYTTRRKQGGAQSSNDNAKGAANSAGAQIRRYNEIALAQDINDLFKEWKSMLNDVELILIRASGAASRKLLYENGLTKGDVRIRGFPLNTRRATQSEIIRSFHILTRLQLGSVEDDKVVVKPITKKEPSKVTKKEPVDDPAVIEHTNQLVALIRRNKVPAMKEYLSVHKDLDIGSFTLQPRNTFIHTPTLLHYASASDCEAALRALLDLGANPTTVNSVGKTPFDIAGSKSTRDAYRIWRGRDGHESKWDWDAAHVPVALSEEQIQARQAQLAAAKAEEEALENNRRQQELERLEVEASQAREREERKLESKRGPGRTLAMSMGVLGQSSSTSLDGVTPEMRQKIERERRARAAEARFAKK